MDYKYTSRSEKDTLELAQNMESEKFPNMVICLEGELGSGKTVFVKGFAHALGILENVTSPTFTFKVFPSKVIQGTCFSVAASTVFGIIYNKFSFSIQISLF